MLNRATNRRKNKIISALAGFLAVLLISSLVIAAGPQTVGIAGRLTNAAGAPSGGSFNFTFLIYTAQTGGTAIWTEPHDGRAAATSVSVKNGVWSTVLGNNTSLALPWDQQYYLEIVVNNEVLSPRTAFSAMPYILNSTNTGGYNFTGNVNFNGPVVVNNTLYFNNSTVHFLNGVNALNMTMTGNNITGGTIGNARLDSNIAWENETNVFTGVNSFSGQTNITGGATGAARLYLNNTTIHILSAFVGLNATIDAANITTGTLGNARIDALIYFMNSTGMNAANITAGTLGNARLDSNLAWVNATNFFTGTNAFSAQTNFTGGATGAARVYLNNTTIHILSDFVGLNATLDAANLTTGALPVARISTGTIGNARLDALIYFMNSTGMNAANITAGTLGNARLDTNIDWVNASQTFTAAKTFNAPVHFTAPNNTIFNLTIDPRNITNSSANTFLNHTLLPVFENTSASYAPSGVIIQFGNVTYPALGPITFIGQNITLNKPYASASTYTVIVTEEASNATGLAASAFGVHYISGSTFGISNTTTIAGPTSLSHMLHWIAIGY